MSSSHIITLVVVKALVSFKELTDMQKLLSEVLSFSLLPEQIAGLREEFAKIDNGDGEITLSDLKTVLMENAEAGSLGALTEEEVEGELDILFSLGSFSLSYFLFLL